MYNTPVPMSIAAGAGGTAAAGMGAWGVLYAILALYALAALVVALTRAAGTVGR